MRNYPWMLDTSEDVLPQDPTPTASQNSVPVNGLAIRYPSLAKVADMVNYIPRKAITDEAAVSRYGITTPSQAKLKRNATVDLNNDQTDSQLLGSLGGGALSLLISSLNGGDANTNMKNMLPAVQNANAALDIGNNRNTAADSELKTSLQDYYKNMIGLDKFNDGIVKGNNDDAIKLAEEQLKVNNQSKNDLSGHTFTDSDGNVHQIIFDKNGGGISTKPVLGADGKQLKGNPTNAQDDILKKFQTMTMLTDLKNKKDVVERKLADDLAGAKDAMIATKDEKLKTRYQNNVASIEAQLRKLRLDSHSQMQQVQKSGGFEVSPWEDWQTKDMTPEERKTYGVDTATKKESFYKQ